MDDAMMTRAKRVKVTRHGQTTLPKELREAVGIREGGEVLVEVVEKGLRVSPIQRLEDCAGSLSRFGKYSDWVRDLDRAEAEEE